VKSAAQWENVGHFPIQQATIPECKPDCGCGRTNGTTRARKRTCFESVPGFEPASRTPLQELKLATWVYPNSDFRDEPYCHPRKCRARASKSLDRTSHRRKSVVRVRADQTNRTDHQHKNYRKHHGVFCNILSLVLVPQPAKKRSHKAPPKCWVRLYAHIVNMCPLGKKS
jgi:hypothetical protein